MAGAGFTGMSSRTFDLVLPTPLAREHHTRLSMANVCVHQDHVTRIFVRGGEDDVS